MKYNVIYADPPWGYNNSYVGGAYRRKDGTVQTGRAKDKYQTMPASEIAAMPIPDITEKNSLCFLWVTVPLLPEGLQVLSAWGFQYKTMVTWRKIMSLGMGYWFRGQCEHLILGVKGKVKAFRQQQANFYESNEFDLDECYQSKVGKHSEKPQYFRELINRAVPVSFDNPKKLELFARSREGLFRNDEYVGWSVYGNEVDNSINLK